MSDDREKPKPGGTRGGVIPAELVPFLREHERPKMQRLGEDPKLDAAVAAFKALDKEPDDAEPPVQDLSIGMGNASTYVAPVEVQAAAAPRDPADASPAKVEIGGEDVPRALPEGSRTAETVETRALRFRPGEEGDATIPRASDGRTVGGGTARLPVVKAASPWAKEAPAAPVAPVELPSAHAPAPDSEPASGPPAAGGRDRRKGLVLAGVLVGIAALIVLRVATTRTEAPGDRTSSAATSATASEPASASATTAPTSAAPPASVAPSAQPTGSATPEPPEASTSAPQIAPPAPSGGRHPPGKRAPSDDPYDAAVAPSPVVTALPSAAPSAPPAPPQPAVAPKATASNNPFDKPNYD